MEVVVVPWTPGPLIRVEDGRAGDDLRRACGVPIDLSDPDVFALVDAYEALLAKSPPDESKLTAGHFALLETASLLRSGPPGGPAEREYVRRRKHTIADLVGIELIGPERLGAVAYLRAEIYGR